MEINEYVMCANFGDLRSRDRELRQKKKHNKWRFLARKFINLPIAQKPLGVHS